MRIVFDWAGVLFHWQPRQLLRRTLPQHAVDEASAAVTPADEGVPNVASPEPAFTSKLSQ